MCSPNSQAGGGQGTNRQFLGGPAVTGTATADNAARNAAVTLTDTSHFAVLLIAASSMWWGIRPRPAVIRLLDVEEVAGAR